MANNKSVVLVKSHRKPAPGAREVGEVDPNEVLELTIRVRSRSQEDKGALLEAMSNQAPGKRKYLTRAQLSDQFGADQGDVDKVVAYARDNGLEVTSTSLPRRTVMVKGTVQNLTKAFPTELKHYESDLGNYRGRTGPLQIPQQLEGIVTAVLGFDNRRQARAHAIVRTSNIKPFRAGMEDVTFTPVEIATIYDFPAGTDGSGECIGIIEFGGGYDTSDLKTYFKNLGIAEPSIVAVSVDGVKNNPNSKNPDDNDADGEVMLDIEVAGAVASKAKIVVYFAPFTEQGWVDALTTAVHDSTHNPSVLSISWGWPEGNDLWTQQAMDAVTSTLQEAGLAGITVSSAAGDDGSADELTDGHAHVDFPAASPYILACGGTTLTASADKTSIVSEVVWNKGPRASGGGATGGGVSEVTPVPAWQAAAGVPASVNSGFKGRGVPDVSADADADTGYKVRVHGQDGAAGGTSAVAPLYAALVARWNQKLGSKMGFMNPQLYSTAPKAFHDITKGDNDTTGKIGGYPAKPGYDACTGLGTPDGSAIIAALAGPVSSGGGSSTNVPSPNKDAAGGDQPKRGRPASSEHKRTGT